MTLLDNLLVDLVAAPRAALSLPEHRQIELYSRRSALSFAPVAAQDLPLAELAGACRAFAALDTLASSFAPNSEGGGSSWERYRNLPRGTLGDKLLAEIYRMLRLLWKLAAHPDTRIDDREGAFKFSSWIDGWVMSIKISRAGLSLLESAASYYLQARCQPYSAAYVEAMLAEYHADIVGEIREFCDENRGLLQFRRKFPFNRHLRLDCDNPKTRSIDGMLEFEIGAAYRDKTRYPIDFFLIHDDALHIVPVEALTDNRLPIAELGAWRTQIPEGAALPAEFRTRFFQDRRLMANK
jgi:hypothetical protein